MRLIDADALKKAVEEFPNCYNGWSDAYDKSYIIGAIEEQPSIDPMRGEWIRDRYWSRGVGMGEEYGYTRCGFNFCPYCGADMRKEK